MHWMELSLVLRNRHLWGSVLLATWLASAVAAFWWFTLKDLRNFSGEPLLGEQAFDGQAATRALEVLLASHGPKNGETFRPKATIVHFWDSDCACSRFNESHVQQLASRYRADGIQLLVVDRQQLSTGELQRAFGQSAHPYQGMSPLKAGLQIPASPAAAVFDDRGKLAYFGPYSEGAACLSGNGDFVEQVIDKLLAGEHPTQINVSAYGCFCNWADKTPGTA